jgi:mannosyltransferase OCH1-like enzyme
MPIPKIIWQTYECRYDDLSEDIKQLTKSFIKNNPDWDYRYASEKDRAALLEEYFGKEWLAIYHSYQFNVCRADLWRYIALYVYGGVYSDIDILCKDSLDLWVDYSKDFIVSSDTQGAGLTQKLFASSPGSIFIKNILDNIKEEFYLNNKYTNVIDYEIYRTGYHIFTTSIFQTLGVDAEFKLDDKMSNEYNKLDSAVVYGFLCYTGKDALLLHEEFGSHYNAGDGDVFDSSYVAWKREKIWE